MARDIDYLLLCKDVYLVKKNGDELDEKETLNGVQTFGVKAGDGKLFKLLRAEMEN